MLRSGVTLEVNQRPRVDFALQVGQVNETVEVAATAPLLESQSSSLGSVISERFVNELPLSGRNFVQLAILSPGVNGVGFSVTGTVMSGARPDDRRPGSEIFSNGNREGANNFLYDGADNNERLTLSIVLRPAVEAVKEFKVQYSDNVTFTSGKNTWKFGGDIRRRQFTDWRALLPPVPGTSPGQPSSAPIGFDRPRADLHADVSPSKSTARLFLCWFNVKWRIGALR